MSRFATTHWPQTVFDRVLDQLERKASRRGRGRRMAGLRPFLIGAETAGASAEVAAEWGVGESAVRTAVHRLRKDFVGLLLEELSVQTQNPQHEDGVWPLYFLEEAGGGGGKPPAPRGGALSRP